MRRRVYAFLAWLALLGAVALGRIWATALLLAAPLALGADLGLAPRRWRRSLLVFAGLSALTLPAWVLLAHVRLEPDLLRVFAVQLVVAAFPEELFFRGYLQRVWASGRRIRVLGAEVGWEWPFATACFALTHVVRGGAAGLLTFGPGLLMGWAYARTGSIWAGVLYHAACNALAVPLCDTGLP